jgi:hypothetical protein
MDPFTIALATFGVQKLRGKSTSRALRDAALAGGIGYGIGQLGGAGLGIGQGSAFSSLGFGAQTAAEIGAVGAGTGTTAAATTGGIPSLTAGTGGEFAGASLLEPVSVANPGSFLTNYSATTAPTGIFSTAGIDQFGSIQDYLSQTDPSKLTPAQRASEIAQQAGKTLSERTATTAPTGFFGKAADLYGKLGTAEKIGLGVAGASLLGGEEEDPDPIPGTTPEERAAAQAQATAQMDNLTSKRGAMPTYSGSPYNYGSNFYKFNTGGIVSALPKFSVGGINYLPSKQTHDENDVHNYVRATGYVEDGSGNGDKDEDTILAQLADGEFVSRADAILGAGIMEGASPSSMKDMRKKGAAFFYDQQAKFKRVYDLLDASRKNN